MRNSLKIPEQGERAEIGFDPVVCLYLLAMDDIAGADTHRFELQKKWSTENLVFINFLKKKNTTKNLLIHDD